MAFDIKSIQTGTRNLPPRIALLGTPKVGKTTFASGAPKPILIPVKGEEGSDALDVARFPIVEHYDQLGEALTTLANDEHEFSTVIIDSTSTLEPLIWEKVCTEHKVKSIEQVLKGYGKGYTEALHYWRELITALDYLRNEKGMASILIGHVVVKPYNDPMEDPYDQYVWDVHKSAAGMLTKWVDAILFAKYEVFSKTEQDGQKKIRRGTGTERRMCYTQERPSHPGGGRGVYGQLPYEIDLTWEAFSQAIQGAKA